ncbi:MAG: hypothetical protein HC869_14445 [Rhodospirillales bacterium]|nr:hypothetical protein [Rhodospirillales bacterium]
MADQQQPMYRAYTLVEREHEKPFWLNIGVAFNHKDAKGFNLILQALPLTGKLVLRQYEEQPGGGAEDTTSKPKRKASQPAEQP